MEKNITPDDIEEFDSKLRQIGGHNTTGTMVSNNNFAKTTINITITKDCQLKNKSWFQAYIHILKF